MECDQRIVSCVGCHQLVMRKTITDRLVVGNTIRSGAIVKKKNLLVSLLNVFENRSWLDLPFLGKNIYLFILTIAERYVKYRTILLGRPILKFALDQWPFV